MYYICYTDSLYVICQNLEVCPQPNTLRTVNFKVMPPVEIAKLGATELQ